MKEITYEVRYGNPEINIKVIKQLTLERAQRLYDRAKRFAEDSGLTWTIALWLRGHECMAGAVGLEPTTNGFGDHYSTN